MRIHWVGAVREFFGVEWHGVLEAYGAYFFLSVVDGHLRPTLWNVSTCCLSYLCEAGKNTIWCSACYGPVPVETMEAYSVAVPGRVWEDLEAGFAMWGVDALTATLGASEIRGGLMGLIGESGEPESVASANGMGANLTNVLTAILDRRARGEAEDEVALHEAGQ